MTGAPAAVMAPAPALLVEKAATASSGALFGSMTRATSGKSEFELDCATLVLSHQDLRNKASLCSLCYRCFTVAIIF
jgi:hypothetical protein